MVTMARGWESKSVEAQQEMSQSSGTAEAKAPLSKEQLLRKQQQAALELARKRVQHDLDAATNERHRAMLQKALADLTAQITALG
jgi:hypothetical protein